MAKPDGRIEKGQRLASAISARAWNRAQDAADIVLGVRPGFSVPQTQSTGLDHVFVRVPETYPQVSSHPLEVGHGLSFPLQFGGGLRLASQSQNLPSQPTGSQYIVPNESDIPAYDAASVSAITLPAFSEQFVGTRCGVIESVSSLSDGYYTCRVRVRGLVRCRIFMIQAGNFVSPPPVYPNDQNLRPYWRRYLMASDYGQGAILATGAVHRFGLTSGTFPAIAEALVMLG